MGQALLPVRLRLAAPLPALDPLMGPVCLFHPYRAGGPQLFMRTKVMSAYEDEVLRSLDFLETRLDEINRTLSEALHLLKLVLNHAGIDHNGPKP